MKIVCFHLYNDYSGSPKVLNNVLSGFLERGYDVDLITSKGGVLDSLSSPHLRVTKYPYRFSSNVIVTMLRYSAVQLLTFFIALRYTFSKETVFYINTILPIAPALAGKLAGKKVVYHYHENAYIKSGFYRFLAKGMQKLADRIICVSDYQASFLKRKEGVKTIPNVLEDKFIASLHPDFDAAYDRKNILMLSSLKEYKGTKEFIQLASLLPQYQFTIVINDSEDAVAEWLKVNRIERPRNLSVHSRSEEVAFYYNKASLVVNLSNPDLFVETFGLTALEAMACGLPVIVPTVGGIAEMVTGGVNGYKIDCHDTDRLVNTINDIFNNKSLYMSLAEKAYAYSKNFNRRNMMDSVINIIR